MIFNHQYGRIGLPYGLAAKNLPARQETRQGQRVQLLGWEDSLEKEMTIYPVKQTSPLHSVIAIYFPQVSKGHLNSRFFSNTLRSLLG